LLPQFSTLNEMCLGQNLSQALGFGRGEYIFMGQDFRFYYMFKTNFSEHNKIWGEQKKLVDAPVAAGLAWDK